MPEIPLSIGSKLEQNYMYFSELLSLPNFRILPRTFTHLSTYVHVYCRVYIVYIYTMYMTEMPRVLHFSAFIIYNVHVHVCMTSMHIYIVGGCHIDWNVKIHNSHTHLLHMSTNVVLYTGIMAMCMLHADNS